MRIQITLTSAEGKRIIAKGVKAHPRVRQAGKEGKVLLKGGTTVSAVSEELCGTPMKISGMITPKGTLTSRYKHEIPLPHALILQGGRTIPLDSPEAWQKETAGFSPRDLVVTSANAFDAYGNAVIMAGSPGGGAALPFFHALLLEGVPFLIAVGLEKFVPGNLLEVAPLAGRQRPDLSYGMAVGLMPVFGEIFTEVQALEALFSLQAHVIGKGGIHGAEGGTTFLLEGPEKEIRKLDRLYQGVKGAGLSGDPRNLIPCQRGSLSCKNHIGCLYKKGQRE